MKKQNIIGLSSKALILAENIVKNWIFEFTLNFRGFRHDFSDKQFFFRIFSAGNEFYASVDYFLPTMPGLYSDAEFCLTAADYRFYKERNKFVLCVKGSLYAWYISISN